MYGLLWIIFGYLLGSCPTGFLVVKIFKGQDIRTVGSGNIGATNVGRVMGKGGAFFVAIFDMLKGGVAVALATYCGVSSPWIIALVGAAGVLGHDYPVWLAFKGGKGVATTFGVVFFYDWFNPLPALLGGAVWYGVMKKSRYVSLASITSLYICPLALTLTAAPAPYLIVSLFLAVLCTWRHRANIVRLVSGTESKTKEASS